MTLVSTLKFIVNGLFIILLLYVKDILTVKNSKTEV